MLLTTPDGLHDIEVVGRASGGNWYATGFDFQAQPGPTELSVASTTTFERWNPNVNWADVRSGDFDGDGLTDLIGRDSATGNWWVTLSDGVVATTRLATNWNPAGGWADVAVADLAAAGDRGTRGHFTRKSDLVGRASNGTWYAALSNGDGTFTNVALTWWNPAAGWHDVLVADLNGDKAADLAGRASDGTWWASLSDAGTGESLGYGRPVALGHWNEAAGWRDVMVAPPGFLHDPTTPILGRASDGTWWALKISGGWQGSTRTPESGRTERIGDWNEAAGWRDVAVSGGTLYGRTSTGEWWTSTPNPNGTFAKRRVATWNEAAGWRDVQVIAVPYAEAFSNRAERTGIIGRTAAGEWYLWDGERSTILLGRWNAAAGWRDMQVGRVTAQLVYTLSEPDYSYGSLQTLYIRGHRSGTSVLVEEVPQDSSSPVDHTLKVTYTIPATGYRLVTTVRVFFQSKSLPLSPVLVYFTGHLGVDSFVDHSGADTDAGGMAGADTLDGRGVDANDRFFGGDGIDTLLGNPGDTLNQET